MKKTVFTDFTSVFRRFPDAVAVINGSPDYPRINGRVLFWGVRNGVVVRADVTGLPDNKGKCKGNIFGFHIHSGNECEGNTTDFYAFSEGHYNPDNCPHPYHSGDLPPLFGSKGKAYLSFLTDRFSVEEIIGKTIIIHLEPDDFKTRPSGDSGEKIACGIINSLLR